MSNQLNLKKNESNPIDIGVARKDRKALADELLFGKLVGGGHIHIDVAPGGETLTLTSVEGVAPAVAAGDDE